MAEKRRSHPQAPLYYPGNAAVNQAEQYAGSVTIEWPQVLNTPTTRDGYGITDVYTIAEADAEFLTAAEADALFLTPAEGNATYSPLGHTHDDRYYTETELDAGQLDNRYYTETEVDALFAGLDPIPVVLDDLTDVNAPTPADGDVLTWDNGAGEWVAAAPTAGGGTIDGSGTANKVTKWSDSDTLTDSSLSDDGSIVSSPNPFHIGNYDSAVDPNTAGLYVLGRQNIVREGSAGILDLGRVNTSIGAPTAIGSAETVGTIQFNGWDGSAYSRGAFITAQATEAWDGSGRGTALLFRTTPNNSTTQTQALEITENQEMILSGHRFTFGPSGSTWIEEDVLNADTLNIGTDSATDDIWLYFGGSSRIGFATDAIFPGSDNSVDIGTTALRFRDLKGAGEVKWGDFSTSFRYAWIDDTLGYRLTLRTDDNGVTTPLYLVNADFGTASPSRGVRLQFWGGTAQAGTPINAGMIEVGPLQAWTSTASTQDAIMMFLVAKDGTLSEVMRLTGASPNSMRMSGTIDFATSNTYDIGSSGNDPRSVRFITSVIANGTKVLGTQGAAVADSSATVASVSAQLNALLARLRGSTGHGLIAG